MMFYNVTQFVLRSYTFILGALYIPISVNGISAFDTCTLIASNLCLDSCVSQLCVSYFIHSVHAVLLMMHSFVTFLCELLCYLVMYTS